jgi:hypothetical protein
VIKSTAQIRFPRAGLRRQLCYVQDQLDEWRAGYAHLLEEAKGDAAYRAEVRYLQLDNLIHLLNEPIRVLEEMRT